MIIPIVPIGNSKGIRIPKHILDSLDIQDKVELEIHEQEITIKSVYKKPRQGWDEAFSSMHKQSDDKLILSDMNDTDIVDWEW